MAMDGCPRFFACVDGLCHMIIIITLTINILTAPHSDFSKPSPATTDGPGPLLSSTQGTQKPVCHGSRGHPEQPGLEQLHVCGAVEGVKRSGTACMAMAGACQTGNLQLWREANSSPALRTGLGSHQCLSTTEAALSPTKCTCI